MPEPTITKWTPRISRDPDKWSRVEVEGAGAESEPIALVKDPKHARAIAALPALAQALVSVQAWILGNEKPSSLAQGRISAAALVAEALAAMEGRAR